MLASSHYSRIDYTNVICAGEQMVGVGVFWENVHRSVEGVFNWCLLGCRVTVGVEKIRLRFVDSVSDCGSNVTFVYIQWDFDCLD